MNFYEMTRDQYAEHIRKLLAECPTADWMGIQPYRHTLVFEGRLYFVKHVPAKRTFVTCLDAANGNKPVKLTRKKCEGKIQFATPELNEVSKKTHWDFISRAIAERKRIPAAVKYDYPEHFTPFTDAHSPEFRERFAGWWDRFNNPLDHADQPKWHRERLECLRSQLQDRAEREANSSRSADAQLDLAVIEHIAQHVHNTVAPDHTRPMNFEQMEAFVGCTAEDVRAYNNDELAIEALTEAMETLHTASSDSLCLINEAASEAGLGEQYMLDSAAGDYAALQRHAALLADLVRSISGVLNTDGIGDKARVNRIAVLMAVASRKDEFEDAIMIPANAGAVSEAA